MSEYDHFNTNSSIIKKIYVGFALIIILMTVLLAFSYKISIDESNASSWNNHTYEVIEETNTLLASILNMETGMRGYTIVGIDSFLEPYNKGKRDFSSHLQKVLEITQDNPGQQKRFEELRHAEQYWEEYSSKVLEVRRNVNSGQVSMGDIVALTQTMQGKKAMDQMRGILEEISHEEWSLLQLRGEALRESERISRQVTMIGGGLSVVMILLFAFLITSDIKQKNNTGKKLEQMSSELQDINATLEEEVMERQSAQHSLQQLNAELETKVKERTQQLQELNATLEEEIMERQAVEETLEQLNTGLENKVIERTGELQDINAILEEEVMERQAAQETLVLLNDSLETKVSARTQELQATNATLEEEIIERQAAQDAMLTIQEALQESGMKLRHFSDELLENNKELTSFANSIAHDFRSPMVNLKGFSSELRGSFAEIRHLLRDDSVGLPEKVQEKLDEVLDKDVPESLSFIYSSVDRLDRMVNALLKLARVGRQEYVLQDVDMADLVQQTIQSFGHQIQNNNIQIRVGSLPTVKANRLAMEQITVNLLDNAVKYLMPSRPGKITVTCKEEDKRYLFSVEDNGRGIVEKDYEKIFQVFRRSGQQDIPGDGMGLAYVRRLVRQLGGRVWCESELGVSTAMKFTVVKQS